MNEKTKVWDALNLPKFEVEPGSELRPWTSESELLPLGLAASLRFRVSISQWLVFVRMFLALLLPSYPGSPHWSRSPSVCAYALARASFMNSWPWIPRPQTALPHHHCPTQDSRECPLYILYLVSKTLDCVFISNFI